MITIVNYIRQMFCKHDWNIEEERVNHNGWDGSGGSATKVYMRCKKCGYHAKHCKFI